MADEVSDAIEASATAGIAATAEDGRSTTAMSINDQIAADKYLAAKRNRAKGMNAILRQQMAAPSGTGE